MEISKILFHLIPALVLLYKNGEKFVDAKNGRVHIGVSNVRDRIQYLYGEPYGMQIMRGDECGTKVVLTLPVKKHKSKESKV